MLLYSSMATKPEIRFLHAQLWHQIGHILASGTFFLCIQSITRIIFGSKQASKLSTVQYSDVLQTLVIIENIYIIYIYIYIYHKIPHKDISFEKLKPDVSQRPVWALRMLSSSARFQSNYINCSHTRIHTLQTDSTSEINIV